jgi:hypothetical protein
MEANVRAGRARRKAPKNALPIAPDSAISRLTLIPDSSAGRAFDLADPYVQRMCTLARVATEKEPFALLRESAVAPAQLD